MIYADVPGSAAHTVVGRARRRGGVTAWGIALIVVGAIAAVLMAVVVVTWVGAVEQSIGQPTLRGRRDAPRPAPLTLTDVAGAALVLAAGAGMIWTGIGCCLGRRWVRPVIVAGAGLIVATGLLNFLAVWLTLPALLDALRTPNLRGWGGPAVSTYAVLLAWGIRAGLLLGVAVVIPFLALRFFLDARTEAWLDAVDPEPTWLDRRPIPLVAWVALCVLVALSALLRVSEPAVPVFIAMLTGAAAIFELCMVAVLLIWGAWLCWRLDRFGWVLTFALLACLRVSSAVYLWGGGSIADLAADAAAGAAATRLHPAVMAAPWVARVMATLEAAAVVAFGLYVERAFTRRYRVRLVSAGDGS